MFNISKVTYLLEKSLFFFEILLLFILEIYKININLNKQNASIW